MDSASEDDDEELPVASQAPETAPRVNVSLPYQEFLRFLETGCMGSPTAGYPAILVVLSTVPTPVRAVFSFPHTKVVTVLVS